MADPEVSELLAQDVAASREPMPAARALDDRLANWSGGRRYTCPSYEITRLEDAVTVSVPGFQPFAAYDVVLANLVPAARPASAHLTTSPRSSSGPAVPLASQEVATVCEIDLARGP